MTTQPTVNAIEKQGIGTSVIDLASTGGAQQWLGGAYPAAAVLARADWVASHQATVQKVVDALVATMHWINTHSAADIANAMPPGVRVQRAHHQGRLHRRAGPGQGPVPAGRDDARQRPGHRPGDREVRRQRHRPGQPRPPPTPTSTPSPPTSSKASPSNPARRDRPTGRSRRPSRPYRLPCPPCRPRTRSMNTPALDNDNLPARARAAERHPRTGHRHGVCRADHRDAAGRLRR